MYGREFKPHIPARAIADAFSFRFARCDCLGRIPQWPDGS
jgi:hypothetical protein